MQIRRTLAPYSTPHLPWCKPSDLFLFLEKASNPLQISGLKFISIILV